MAEAILFQSKVKSSDKNVRPLSCFRRLGNGQRVCPRTDSSGQGTTPRQPGAGTAGSHQGAKNWTPGGGNPSQGSDCSTPRARPAV